MTVVGGAGASLTSQTTISGVTSATLRGLTISTGSAVAGLPGLKVSSSSGVLLDALTVTGNSWGIRLEHVTSSTLQNSELTDNADALEVDHDGAGVLITGNRIHDNDRFWAADRSYTGVTFYYTTGPLTFSGNQVYGNHSPVGATLDGVGLEIFAASGLTITGNTLYDNTDAVETGTDPALTPCGLTFTGNVVYKSTTDPVEAHGLILRCASGSLVANNTFDGLDVFAIYIVDGSPTVPFSGSIDGLIVRDNIAVNGRVFSIDSALPASVVVNGDLLYNPPGSPAMFGQHLAFVAGHGSTSSLANLRIWTGRETTGLWADPFFVDAVAHDYRLRAGSAAVGKGAYPVRTPLPGPVVPRLDHVFVIVEENRDYGQIIGSAEAPYLNFLADEGASATDYHALARPSLPDYLALIGGDTFGVTTDCRPADPGCSFAAPNLADRLDAAGLTWRGYFDGMPEPCRTTSSGSYRVHHNPFVYFDDIRTDAPRCAAGVRPLGDLAADLGTASGTPTLALVVPDNCNDMHDCSIATGDAWLRRTVPAILDSPVWLAGNSLLIITVDEDSGTPGNANRVPALFYGPSVRPHSAFATTSDHYSLLRTLETSWSLPTLTANDAAARSMDALFRVAPPADTTPPSVPGTPVATASTGTRVDLTWPMSTDNTAVTRYEVYRDGAWLGSSVTTSFTDFTVVAGTTYTYRVRARDNEGNVSGYSAPAAVTTQPPPPPTGHILRAAVGTVVNTTATNLVTIPAPAGLVSGDVLVACLTLNGGGVATAGIPAGWTPIATVTSLANPKVLGYYHVAGTSEPPSYGWTLSSAVTNGAGIARYTGVNTLNPIDVPATTATGPAATSGTLPGVTTVTDGAMLVGCMAVNSSSTAITIGSPPGLVEAWDLGGKRHELADGAQDLAGPSGPKTWTFSSGREWAGWLVALRSG